jgi:hypothetical protein
LRFPLEVPLLVNFVHLPARPLCLLIDLNSHYLTQPTNAIKKPIDSSARNLLIYIGVTGEPSGLRPVLGGVGRRENVQMESKACRLLAEMALSEVRKNPQEPAQTRGSRSA